MSGIWSITASYTAVPVLFSGSSMYTKLWSQLPSASIARRVLMRLTACTTLLVIPPTSIADLTSVTLTPAYVR